MKETIIDVDTIEDIEILSEKLAEALPMVQKPENVLDVKREVLDFESLMRGADMLARSTIVPIAYQNRAENCFIALDMASRMGVSPLVVMQNLFVIQGKPSFSGQAIASMIRSSRQFKNVTLNYTGTVGTDKWGAYITAEDTRNGNQLKGSTVTIAIAKAEGWYGKTGSKWLTMPEQMLGYRAYAWFGRLYAPELLMGLQSVEEIEDVSHDNKKVVNPYE